MFIRPFCFSPEHMAGLHFSASLAVRWGLRLTEAAWATCGPVSPPLCRPRTYRMLVRVVTLDAMCWWRLHLHQPESLKDLRLEQSLPPFAPNFQLGEWKLNLCCVTPLIFWNLSVLAASHIETKTDIADIVPLIKKTATFLRETWQDQCAPVASGSLYRHANWPHRPLPGINGGMCSAGVSFLLGFFWSDSMFRATCTFFPFLGFFLSSQSLMNWSERSSDFDRMQRKRQHEWVRA